MGTGKCTPGIFGQPAFAVGTSVPSAICGMRLWRRRRTVHHPLIQIFQQARVIGLRMTGLFSPAAPLALTGGNGPKAWGPDDDEIDARIRRRRDVAGAGDVGMDQRAGAIEIFRIAENVEQLRPHMAGLGIAQQQIRLAR